MAIRTGLFVAAEITVFDSDDLNLPPVGISNGPQPVPGAAGPNINLQATSIRAAKPAAKELRLISNHVTFT
ncbi:MAG: hypothetical protein M0Z50_19625 [Planctomycetia bacterium]|nr:hypothetical protein [Planctomycetia bacterium]